MHTETHSADLQSPSTSSPAVNRFFRYRALLLALVSMLVLLACTLVCGVVLTLNIFQPPPTKPATIIVSGIGYQINSNQRPNRRGFTP